jgi:hypothetical protein
MSHVKIISNDANRQALSSCHRIILRSRNIYEISKKPRNMRTAETVRGGSRCPSPHAANTRASGRHTVPMYRASVLTIVKMNKKRISSRLQMILHSLATRVPKILLYRAEHMFPALNTSMVSVLSSRL